LSRFLRFLTFYFFLKRYLHLCPARDILSYCYGAIFVLKVPLNPKQTNKQTNMTFMMKIFCHFCFN